LRLTENSRTNLAMVAAAIYLGLKKDFQLTERHTVSSSTLPTVRNSSCLVTIQTKAEERHQSATARF